MPQAYRLSRLQPRAIPGATGSACRTTGYRQTYQPAPAVRVPAWALQIWSWL